MLEQKLREALQARRPEPPKGFEARSDRQLALLIGQKGSRAPRKAARLVLAFALLLALSLVTAAAVSNGWSVRAFLLGFPEGDRADFSAQEIGQEFDLRDVCMRIDSALYDGRSLIFDWFIQNKSQIPMYCYVRHFTANGERLYTDGTDSFDCSWIFCGEENWRDGEIVLLPETLMWRETLRVEMGVTVYYPDRPVYLMEEFDPDLTARKAEEGYFVIPGPYENVGFDPEEKQWFVYSLGLPSADLGGFRTVEMEFSFDVSMPAGRIHHLSCEPVYTIAHGQGMYKTLDITSLGLYASLEVEPGDGYFRQPGAWALTDGSGNPLYASDEQQVKCQYAAYGMQPLRCDFQGYGVKEDDLPDVISLTWLPESGQPVLFPARVR